MPSCWTSETQKIPGVFFKETFAFQVRIRRGVQAEGVFLGNPKDSGRGDGGTLGNIREHMGVSKNRGTPKWMVKIMENPILGVMFLFLETSI